MDKFLEAYNLLSLNHKKTENLNRLIEGRRIKPVIKDLPTKKSPGSSGFTIDFTKHLKNNANTQIIQVKKWAEGLNRHFPREHTEVQQVHEKFSTTDH